MRIKETKSNWNASGIIKRDFRHDSSQPQTSRVKSKKDTRKWCKGKVGVEHDYEYQFPKNDMIFFRMMAVCLTCGRQDSMQVLYWCGGHEEWEDYPSWDHKNASLFE